MKPLKSSMKENKRYLLLKGENLRSEVERAILDFVGVLGYAKASPSWIELKKDSGILSVNREEINAVRGSFFASHSKIKVERVSGTLKGLKNEKHR